MGSDNAYPKYLVVAPPRGGFTLLISVINELYHNENINKDAVQIYINKFVPLASEIVSKAINKYFSEHIKLDDLFYSGEFRNILVGGPKWLDKDESNTICVRKYLGVKGLGDFTFIQYHPKYLLDYDEVVHSHNHPGIWIDNHEFRDYRKFTSIRNPIDIIHSSVYSINALASEYIQRCVDQDESTIRYKLALNKFTNPAFMEGLVIYLVNYLKDFMPVRDKFRYVMKWEDLILRPVETILKIAHAGEFNISKATAKNIWERIQFRNLTRWHRHSFRKGVIGDWKNSITNIHLELFKSHGFDELLETLGYDRIKYFKESAYSPVQKDIEACLKKGKVYKSHEDEDLYTFAFNKTNLTSSKFTFKSYPRVGDIYIERSTFKDEHIIEGFRNELGNTIANANHFLTEIREIKLLRIKDETIALNEIQTKYRKIFGESMVNDIPEYERAFSPRGLDDKQGRVPRLMESYKSYNIVKLGNDFYAVPQKLGPLDLQKIDMSLYKTIIQGNSIHHMKTVIDSGRNK